MLTFAQQRLAALDRWFDRNSRGGNTPNGGVLSVGRFASIIPWAFDKPPIATFDTQAMVFLVSNEQASGIGLSEFLAAEPIDSQRDIGERIEHVLWLAEDGRLPPCVVVALLDPLEPVSAAVARAGVAGADLDALPVLAVPLWALADGPRARIAARLPLVPPPGATDPEMPEDEQPRFTGVRTIWP